MKSSLTRNRSCVVSAAIFLAVLAHVLSFGQTTSPLVGVWVMDEGFQITEFVFRSDGRYQIDTRSTDPNLNFAFSEKGYYDTTGQALATVSDEYLGEPQVKQYAFQVAGNSLSLMRIDFPLPEAVYQYKPGSREDVLAREAVEWDVVGTWTRHIEFFGSEEYTFRPGGYYFRKSTPLDSQFPPEYVRGRYDVSEDGVLTLKPYSGVEAIYQLDFFGNNLTLITIEPTFGESKALVEVPGSEEVVRAKSAEAEAFLSQENWQVGLWEIRDNIHTVDLTIRPDGHYISSEMTEFLEGIVRGRYALEPRRIQFLPFVGQGIYARSNGEFGKVERIRELDYYDGELQFIDLGALSQSVTLARKKAGSQAPVLEKVQQAQLVRAQEGWQIGVWEVNDPAGWMEFTFRPDGRYIAKSGTAGVPGRVERGQYVLRGEKLTLAPYSGQGAARGFEIDLYDGDLFLVGDLNRMVVARKIPDSETEVIEKTTNPTALKGERGSILGLWTAHLPGASAELVFRPDGEFRLTRCGDKTVSRDYGLYTVDMAARTVIYDSRFTPVQTLGLDFYGETMTLYGGLSAPSTYTVNLGVVDAAIQASHDADTAEAQVDAQWLARIPIAVRDPNAVQIPTGNIPADPFPTRIFESPTVFPGYQLYRRLILGFVYFNEGGTIKSVPVVNTREWHFFPTGRVLVRFKNYSAGVYPNTIEDISDSWGAYRIEPKPTERDILHLYADNSVFIEMDSGDQEEMTLEDGRRHLFWGKDYQIQSEWAAEQKPIPCEPPANGNASLVNTGLELATSITPDSPGNAITPSMRITGPIGGMFTVSGTNATPATLVIEATATLALPVAWTPIQTNAAPAGPFSFQIAGGTNKSAYFRLRSP